MEEEMQNRQSFEVASQGGKNTDHADAPSAQQRVAVAPFSRDLLPQPRLSVAFFPLVLGFSDHKAAAAAIRERQRTKATGRCGRQPVSAWSAFVSHLSGSDSQILRPHARFTQPAFFLTQINL